MNDPISYTRRLFRTLYMLDINGIEEAYHSARARSDDEISRLGRELSQIQSNVAAGLAPAYHHDADGQMLWQAGDNIFSQQADIERVLALIREAFTIILHHFWERTVTQRLQESRYDETKHLMRLSEINFQPDVDGLKILRLAANVAKHSTGESARILFNLRPSMFETSVKSSDDADYHSLRLTDQDLDGFFATLRKSAPQ